MSNSEFEVDHSQEWSDDFWYIDQENRDLIQGADYWIINEG